MKDENGAYRGRGHGTICGVGRFRLLTYGKLPNERHYVNTHKFRTHRRAWLCQRRCHKLGIKTSKVFEAKHE
jgi:hypothetical protein